jgi:von Willebrand factor type A domain
MRRPVSSEKTLWLVLIDVSGSMGSPLTNKGDFSGFVEFSSSRSKLEAAKDALLRQVAGLGPDTDVAIITFSDTASLVYIGSPLNTQETQEVRRQVEPLTPGAGTNIASALDFARQVPHSHGYKIATALIITDGLSNIEDSVSSARACARQGICINTILIDVSPEGETVARAISIGGRVTAVTSLRPADEGAANGTAEERLQNQVREAAQDHRHAAERAKPQESQIPLLALVVSSLAALATLATAFLGAVSKPAVGPFVLAAALSTLGLAASCYLYFARRPVSHILAPHGELPEVWLPKYSHKTRRRSLIGIAFSSIVLTGSLFAAFRLPESPTSVELGIGIVKLAGPGTPASNVRFPAQASIGDRFMIFLEARNPCFLYVFLEDPDSIDLVYPSLSTLVSQRVNLITSQELVRIPVVGTNKSGASAVIVIASRERNPNIEAVVATRGDALGREVLRSMLHDSIEPQPLAVRSKQVEIAGSKTKVDLTVFRGAEGVLFHRLNFITR